MAKQDFYDILGVAKSADADELKRAYRKLAMQFHPDRNPGDKSAEQKFKSISEAYDVLKDDQKRRLRAREEGAEEAASSRPLPPPPPRPPRPPRRFWGGVFPGGFCRYLR